ncbi:hypothetical protein MPSEU_000520500 [Mayamaea pseudoterrestris]|nr:hypothetical protein MPSEU_000520500 [Mayamaea pseudoterrestris]
MFSLDCTFSVNAAKSSNNLQRIPKDVSGEKDKRQLQSSQVNGRAQEGRNDKLNEQADITENDHQDEISDVDDESGEGGEKEDFAESFGDANAPIDEEDETKGNADEKDANNDDDDDEEEEEEMSEDEDLQEDSLRFRDTDIETDGSSTDEDPPDATTAKNSQPNVTIAPDIKVIRGNITHPKIAWLMSFPNSGTSFTIHMTREASNTTTATNYAGEGDIKDLPSTQAIEGSVGEQGPFLELIRGRYTNMPEHILTKTHCTGFCSTCGPYKLLFETPRSFMRGCLSGTRAVHGKHGVEIVDTIYDPNLVTKAIHIFRHPLDNTVARFHLEFNEQQAEGNTKYVDKYPKNATGFQKWCARSDETSHLFETRYLDNPLKQKLRKIPCFNEFFKYVQWHNMAFYTTHEMNLEVLYMHYHEYENFERARDKVLKFLELPLIGLGVAWVPGKIYRHYYSKEDKIAIKEFILEYASRDTWNMLEGYDFETDKEVAPEPVIAAS